MKKIYIVMFVLLLLASTYTIASHFTKQSDNITEVRITYGEDELSAIDLIKLVKEINSIEHKSINRDGFELDGRTIELNKLGGRTEEEAIEKALYDEKKTKALKIISKEHNVIVSDDEVEAYLTTLNNDLSSEQKELTAVMAGFASFDEYLKSPKTISATKLYFVQGKYTKLKINEMIMNKSDMDIEEAKSKAIEEVNKEIENIMGKE